MTIKVIFQSNPIRGTYGMARFVVSLKHLKGSRASIIMLIAYSPTYFMRAAVYIAWTYRKVHIKLKEQGTQECSVAPLYFWRFLLIVLQYCFL